MQVPWWTYCSTGITPGGFDRATREGGVCVATCPQANAVHVLPSTMLHASCGVTRVGAPFRSYPGLVVPRTGHTFSVC